MPGFSKAAARKALATLEKLLSVEQDLSKVISKSLRTGFSHQDDNADGSKVRKKIETATAVAMSREDFEPKNMQLVLSLFNLFASSFLHDAPCMCST